GGITVAGQRRVHTGFAVHSAIPGNPRDRRSLLHASSAGHEARLGTALLHILVPPALGCHKRGAPAAGAQAAPRGTDRRSATMSEAKTDRELIVPDGGFWPAPEIPRPNIYPMEWRVETEKLAAIYQKSKLMAWNPADLPWDGLRSEDFSVEQRLGIMY